MAGPESRFDRRRPSILGVLAGLMLVVGSLVVPTVAGAQEAPMAAPGYCSSMRDVLDSAYQFLDGPEDIEEPVAEEPLAEIVRLLDELRPLAPDELADSLDALGVFTEEADAEINAAGGVAGLTVPQVDDLLDRLFTVLDPIDQFYGQSCPGANVYAYLTPECDVEGEVYPPSMDVENLSDSPVEVIAGDVVFTVEADGFGSREVSSDLEPDDVLIDGVSGLVRVGSCDFIEEGPDIEVDKVYTAAFVPGCPDLSTPTMPRLVIGLTPVGQQLFEDATEGEDVGSDPIQIPFEVDDAMVVVKFPGGLKLLLDAEAKVPTVSVLGADLPVATAPADCTPAVTTTSAPNQSVPQAGGTAAKPLSPKFTG